MIDTSKWKEFRIGDLFDVSYGKFIEENDVANGVPYITTTAENNGIGGRVKKAMYTGNCITVASDGNQGKSFYQKDAFATSNIVSTLQPKEKTILNEKIAMFIITIIEQESFKYNYGKKFSVDRVRNTIIKLPATDNGEPDWFYMEEFVEELILRFISTSVKSSHIPLKTETWKDFALKDVFELKGGYYNKKPKHSSPGKIPFLAGTEKNNGVTEYYCLDDIRYCNRQGEKDNTLERKIFDAPAIAITVDGSCGNAFYQYEPFTCSHSVTSIQPLDGHKLTPYEGMFICTMIQMEKYRWSYGRKPHDINKLGNMEIKLPATQSGEPDWEWMENYIKNLPYSDKI